jgi:hypothetical protein
MTSGWLTIRGSPPNMRRSSLHSLGTIVLFLFVAIACSRAVEPRSGVTLLVTNGTCQAGRCDSLQVLGFPSNQPATPGGLWSLDLGLITAPQACLTLPPSSAFHVIGVRGDGSRDTTTFTWTSAKALSLGAQPPSSSRFQAIPSTTAFVPANAAGWRITIPSGSQATPSSACKP